MSKLWNDTIGQVISLIENAPGLSNMYKHQCYHSIIRRLIYTNAHDHLFAMYATYKFALQQEMFLAANTPKFAKLWFKINGIISWRDRDVLQVVDNGYDKLFYWMRKNNHINSENKPNYQIRDEDYEQVLLRLAYVLKNPDLITKNNVPTCSQLVHNLLNGLQLDDHCLDKILSLVPYTIFSIMQHVSTKKDSLRVFSILDRLADKILNESPKGIKYDSYQDMLSCWYPHSRVCKSNGLQYYNNETWWEKCWRDGYVIQEILDMCRDGSITVNLYAEFNCWREFNLSPYCGIMASNYNENVIDIICRDLGDGCRILELACKHEHKKMIRAIVGYIHKRCALAYTL